MILSVRMWLLLRLLKYWSVSLMTVLFRLSPSSQYTNSCFSNLIPRDLSPSSFKEGPSCDWACAHADQRMQQWEWVFNLSLSSMQWNSCSKKNKLWKLFPVSMDKKLCMSPSLGTIVFYYLPSSGRHMTSCNQGPLSKESRGPWEQGSCFS